MVSHRDIIMSRDMGHLDITYNKDTAQQYLSFNLTRKGMTAVMPINHNYFSVFIDPQLG